MSIPIITKKIPIVFLVFITVWLRIVNLGYSDYQGDEIKALFLPVQGESLSEYLLDQRKGPIQFVITYAIKLVHPDYTDEFFVRLPFAIAGIFAVYLFYKLVKEHFGKSAALYSSVFLATNGFFIAFSRIVQYQSLTIMFDILALYLFTLAAKNAEWQTKGIYLGFLSWALSILSHYDGVFIAPFVLYILHKWYVTGQVEVKEKYKTLFVGGLIFTVLLALFYIPFILSISDSTRAYWTNRLSGGGEKLSSSKYLFSVYHPIYVIHAYTALTVLGAIYITIKTWVGINTKLVVHDLRARFKDLVTNRHIWLFVWFGAGLYFFERVVNIPGTHIFNYLLPMMIVMALGIILIENVIHYLFEKSSFPSWFRIERHEKIIISLGIIPIFFFMFLQSHSVFVDNRAEYPWESEKFAIWEFSEPTPIFHLSMFGFPYFRHWEQIGEFVTKTENTGFYSTNERKSIARYHIPFPKDTDSAGYYVHILNPQSFEDRILSKKAAYWANKYEPVLDFMKNGEPIARVYYMQPGDLPTIISQGY